MTDLPKLTIVIPTLNRCDTLNWSLRTVIEQNYPNLNIVVSDNCSEDETFGIVHKYTHPRLKYVRTPRRFTMLEHFEYALNYVTEGYISFLGDDDGFLPNAVAKVADIIKKHSPLAVGWRFGNYNWPGLPGYFMIPMANYYRIIDSKTEIQNIFTKNIYQAICFPSLYGGFISIELVNKIKNKYDGYFFHSRIPDFFSGAFIAANVENYIRLEFPITINATSAKSAGFATVNTKVDQKPFEGLKHDSGNVPFHPSLKFIRCNVVPIADALLQVNKLVPCFPKLDMKKVITEIIMELEGEQDENKYRELYDGVKEIGRLNGLTVFAESALSGMKRNPQPWVVKRKFSPVSISLYMDSEINKIENVYQAAALTNELISRKYFLLENSLQLQWVRIAQFLNFLKYKFVTKKGLKF